MKSLFANLFLVVIGAALAALCYFQRAPKTMPSPKVTLQETLPQPSIEPAPSVSQPAPLTDEEAIAWAKEHPCLLPAVIEELGARHGDERTIANLIRALSNVDGQMALRVMKSGKVSAEIVEHLLNCSMTCEPHIAADLWASSKGDLSQLSHGARNGCIIGMTLGNDLDAVELSPAGKQWKSAIALQLGREVDAADLDPAILKEVLAFTCGSDSKGTAKAAQRAAELGFGDVATATLKALMGGEQQRDLVGEILSKPVLQEQVAWPEVAREYFAMLNYLDGPEAANQWKASLPTDLAKKL